MGTGDVGNSVFSTPFHYEPKTALKIKFVFFKKGEVERAVLVSCSNNRSIKKEEHRQQRGGSQQVIVEPKDVICWTGRTQQTWQRRGGVLDCQNTRGKEDSTSFQRVKTSPTQGTRDKNNLRHLLSHTKSSRNGTM